VSDRDTANVLAFELAKMQKHYEDCNPDVGIPPSAETLLYRALEGTGVRPSDIDYHNVLLRFQAWYNQQGR
jgi:hypothetical protein